MPCTVQWRTQVYQFRAMELELRLGTDISVYDFLLRLVRLEQLERGPGESESPLNFHGQDWNWGSWRNWSGHRFRAV